MTKTKIEWTRGDDGTAGEVWNPVTGCDRVSPGCDNCYAERVATRFGRPFIGAVELHDDRLRAPLHWRRPRRVFVNSVSDLFHPEVSDLFLAEVFAVMSLTPQHTYQILTKRHKAMQGVLSNDDWRYKVSLSRRRIQNVGGLDLPPPMWPLPNVWLGVSVENQRYADLRIPYLLRTPAAVRFLSVEPLLGPVDLSAHLVAMADNRPGFQPPIDWCIVGGESGPGARPMHPDWPRRIRDECVSAGVPFFFKQAGSVLAREWGGSGAGTDPEAWPDDLRVRDYPT